MVPTFLHGTLLQGLYTTPKIHIELYGVFTHTVAVDAYRGAGRPEATYLLERLMDLAALEMGRDPVELRKQNFIPAFDGVEQPGYQTQVALQYDSGNYHGVLDRGVEMLDYDEFPKRAKRSRPKRQTAGRGLFDLHRGLRHCSLGGRRVRWARGPACTSRRRCGCSLRVK